MNAADRLRAMVSPLSRAVPDSLLTHWQHTVDLLARIYNVPAALIMRVHPQQIEVFLSSQNQGNPYEPGEKADLHTGLYCETVMARRDLLEVPNALEDPDWDHNPDSALGMIAYLGVPLLWPDGVVFGTICVLDRRTRSFSSEYRALLWQFKETVEHDLRYQEEVQRRTQAEAALRRANAELQEQMNERTNELRQNQTLLQSILNHIPAAIYVKDIQGRYLLANQYLLSVLGFSAQDILGKTEQELFPPEVIATWQDTDQQVIDHDNVINFEHQVTLSEESLTYLTTKFPLYDSIGQIYATSGISLDITERVRAEESMRESEERFRTVADFTYDWEYWIASDGGYQYMSPSCERITGYPPAAFLDDPGLLARIVHPDDREQVARMLHSETTSGNTVEMEFRIITRSGKTCWIGHVCQPVYAADGRWLGQRASNRDITERVQAEEAYRILVDQAQQGLVIFQEQRIVFANATMAAINGYSVEEMLAWTIDDFNQLIYPDDRPMVWNYVHDRLEGKPVPTSYEYRIVRKDGQVRWLEAHGAIIHYRGRAANQGTFTDITERKEIETALRWTQFSLDSSADCICRVGQDGRILYANDAMCAMLGYSREEMLAMRVPDFDPNFPPEAWDERWQLHRLQPTMTFETFHRRKDGQLLPVEVTANWLEFQGQEYLSSFSRDISERKQAEARLQHYAAELEQRAAETQQFAYVVSHDLRAPLVNLKGFTVELQTALDTMRPTLKTVLSLLDEQHRHNVMLALYEDIPEALTFIDAAVTRMDHLITALLKLSRLGRRELHYELLDMQALVQITIQTLTHQIEQHHIQVYIGSLPPVVADETAMEQIVSNILNNAVAYLDPHRPGRIDVWGEQEPDWTVFYVCDNGRGIAPEEKDKVFMPFRRGGQIDVPGEGMGMAYVQALIRRHGGQIWFDSMPGEGTTFCFRLPEHMLEEEDDIQ